MIEYGASFIRGTTMKKKKDLNKKLTIYDYEEKYSSKENNEKAKKLLNIATFALGAIILGALFTLFKDVYDINKYAGYIVGGVEIIAFIALFVLPVIKIRRIDRFEINANAKTVKRAKRHNAKIRLNLANKIIEVYENADCNWYGSLGVEKLISAKEGSDYAQMKATLNEIYATDVKRAGRDIILKCAVKSGTFSAISQKDYTDVLLVTAINLQMIKDLVFLYGFRPSDTKLLKIFSKVLSNSFVAYGLSGVKLGNTVVKTMGDMARGIPILGSAISTLVDSSVQGLGNATLTAVIGRQTIKYLISEYRLQDILDGVEELSSEEEFASTCEELKAVLSANGKTKTA